MLESPAEVKALAVRVAPALRVLTPTGCDESEGGPCRDTDFHAELDGYRQGLLGLNKLDFVDADTVFLFGHGTVGAMAGFLAAVLAERRAPCPIPQVKVTAKTARPGGQRAD